MDILLIGAVRQEVPVVVLTGTLRDDAATKQAWRLAAGLPSERAGNQG
jgi:hypothetical protein